MHSLTKKLTVRGARLLLDGEPFDLRGTSFFNLLYNDAFCRDRESMENGLKRFAAYGVNFLRIWCQWDFAPPENRFIDVQPDRTSLFTQSGGIRERYAERLRRLLTAADALGMAAEVCAFAHERFEQRDWRLFPREIIPVQEKSLENLLLLLMPYRNCILQIWNESSFEAIRYWSIIKGMDPERITANAPGFAGDLGDGAQNRLMDVLTPHTSRSGAFWEDAPREVERLLREYGKPVIDDEPARCGLLSHGGIPGGTRPEQHIEQLRRVRSAGGYSIYHHDMFQNGYGDPATPPDGIPYPDFAGKHRAVMEYMRSM